MSTPTGNPTPRKRFNPRNVRPTPPKPADAGTTYEQTLAEVNQRLARLGQETATAVTRLTDGHVSNKGRIDGHDKSLTALSRGVHNVKTRTSAVETNVAKQSKRVRLAEERANRQQGQIDRQGNVIRITGERLAETHGLVLELQRQVVQNGMPLKTAASGVGMDRDKVVQLLGIQAEEGWTDEDVVNQLADMVGKTSRQVGALGDFFVTLSGRVDAIEHIIGKDGEVITKAVSNIRALEDTVGEINKSRGTSGLGVAIATVVALVAGLVWWLIPFTELAHAGNGFYAVADAWWMALFVAVAVFIVMLGLVGGVHGGSQAKQSKDESWKNDGEKHVLHPSTWRRKRQSGGPGTDSDVNQLHTQQQTKVDPSAATHREPSLLTHK